MPELTAAQRRFVEAHPNTRQGLIEELDISPSRVRAYRAECREEGYGFEQVDEEWNVVPPEDTDPTEDTPPEWAEIEPEGTPDPSDLTDREKYIARELQTGSSIDELTDDLSTRKSVVTQHLRDLRKQGWRVYQDDTTDTIAIEGEHELRSSEHIGTRTRKANRWWEMQHNGVVRAFRGLDTPSTSLDHTSGDEDWITHLTDLHAGDEVRDENGNIRYSTKKIPDVVDYITEQALNLAEKHGSNYDVAHLLWGGDFVTNEGIYSGQFEDLDAWLDEQHDALIDPLVRQLKAFSEKFKAVNVVCQVGNHGQHRASGTSKQANADLILYKSIRNTVSHLQEFDVLENVEFQIGQARPYKNFKLRGGKLKGHLRHGQHRRPQAETSARQKEWLKTLLEHDFDVSCMGHYHISGRIPWEGPPIICSASPKPPDEFIEEVGGRVEQEYRDIATCFGVSDDGITGVFPIDTRKM